MQRIIFFLLCFFVTPVLFSQDVRLSDSVIYIDNKPIAFYYKELNNSDQLYNMEVYNSNDDILMKAEVILFNAPVAELKPFHFYEITFPPTADTFSIYVEEEPFSMVVAKIIRDYNLISNSRLDKKNVSRFIKEYYGGPALTAKIKYIEDYLDLSRHFYEQVARDRSKPVTIVDNEVIMQDGVKIGEISGWVKDTTYYSANRKTVNINSPTESNYNDPMNPRGNNPLQYYPKTSTYERNFRSPTIQGSNSSGNQNIRISNGKYIYIVNGRKVKFVELRDPGVSENKKRSTVASEKNLYQISKLVNKNISQQTDQLLFSICSLIEDYSL